MARTARKPTPTGSWAPRKFLNSNEVILESERFGPSCAPDKETEAHVCVCAFADVVADTYHPREFLSGGY